MHADHSFPRYRGIRRVRLQMAGAGAVSLVLMLALAACSIHIGSSANASGNNNTNGTTVPVKVAHGQDGATLVLLPDVTINGQGPFTFALDTGASTSLIDRPLAQQLKLPQNGTPQPIAGVSGKEQAIPVKIDNWSVGKQIKLPSSTVSSADLFASQRSSGLQGLIGSDIWAQFGKITIDYNAQTLTVYKQLSQVSGGSDTRVASILEGDVILPRAVETRLAA